MEVRIHRYSGEVKDNLKQRLSSLKASASKFKRTRFMSPQKLEDNPKIRYWSCSITYESFDNVSHLHLQIGCRVSNVVLLLFTDVVSQMLCHCCLQMVRSVLFTVAMWLLFTVVLWLLFNIFMWLFFTCFSMTLLCSCGFLLLLLLSLVLLTLVVRLLFVLSLCACVCELGCVCICI